MVIMAQVDYLSSEVLQYICENSHSCTSDENFFLPPSPSSLVISKNSSPVVETLEPLFFFPLLLRLIHATVSKAREETECSRPSPSPECEKNIARSFSPLASGEKQGAH